MTNLAVAKQLVEDLQMFAAGMNPLDNIHGFNMKFIHSKELDGKDVGCACAWVLARNAPRFWNQITTYPMRSRLDVPNPVYSAIPVADEFLRLPPGHAKYWFGFGLNWGYAWSQIPPGEMTPQDFIDAFREQVIEPQEKLAGMTISTNARIVEMV